MVPLFAPIYWVWMNAFRTIWQQIEMNSLVEWIFNDIRVYQDPSWGHLDKFKVKPSCIPWENKSPRM